MLKFVVLYKNINIMTTISTNTATAANRRAYPGAIINTLVSAEQANNSLFIAEFEFLPGSEPPRHVHTVEDEFIFMKEGEVTFFCGDDIIQAKPGDSVFLPKNIPHHFIITSESAKALFVTTPANFGEFFKMISMPYEGTEIPEVQGPPTEEAIGQMVALMASFGINLA
jgi:quercetin dioxygenase-like cupin family protein